MIALSTSTGLGRLALAAAAGLLLNASLVGGALAAPSSASAEAQAQYKRDLALCNSSKATEDRATCRLEANRAYAEAKRGALNDKGAAYQANARQRCDALKGDDRTACEARMRGEGTAQGSVAGGGILRESVTTVPAK